MNSNKKISILYGVLIIAGIISGILNSVPAIEYPDYLTKLSSIKTQILIAVFFQFVMASVYVCIIVLLYPIVKQYSERIALGYFAFRLIGAMFLFIGIISLLLLLLLSQSFNSSGNPSLSYFQTIGELLRNGRDWMNHIGMILPWTIGGFLLYYSFLKMKIIPVWLSIWGIVGSVLVLIGTILLMFDIIKIVTPIYFIFMIPTALFELILAIFLIVKGFSPLVIQVKKVIVNVAE
jgi:hypothetical protein